MKPPINKRNLISTSNEDPVNYYFLPIRGYFYRKRLDLVADVLYGHKFEKLLEIGYGSGIFLPVLKDYCQALYAVDIHQFSKEIAIRLESIGIKAELSTGDIANLPYQENFFDCIVCVSVLEHINNLDKALNQVKRVLKKKGVFVAGFPTKSRLMKFYFQRIDRFNFKRHHPNSEKDIIEKILQYFKIEKIRRFPAFLPMEYGFYVVVKAKNEDIFT